jgi:hypothetical protein
MHTPSSHNLAAHAGGREEARRVACGEYGASERTVCNRPNPVWRSGLYALPRKGDPLGPGFETPARTICIMCRHSTEYPRRGPALPDNPSYKPNPVLYPTRYDSFVPNPVRVSFVPNPVHVRVSFVPNPVRAQPGLVMPNPAAQPGAPNPVMKNSYPIRYAPNPASPNPALYRESRPVRGGYNMSIGAQSGSSQATGSDQGRGKEGRTCASAVRRANP